MHSLPSTSSAGLKAMLFALLLAFAAPSVSGMACSRVLCGLHLADWRCTTCAEGAAAALDLAVPASPPCQHLVHVAKPLLLAGLARTATVP